MSASVPSNTRRYAAWVPTITGQLSFSLLGQGVAAAVVANGAGAPPPGEPTGARHVVLTQSRRTKDLPWPFYLRRAARAEYILIGHTRDAARAALDGGATESVVLVLPEQVDHVGVLEGRILVVPYHAEDAGLRAKQAILDIRKLITQAADSAPRGAPCRLEELGAKVQAVLDRAAEYGVVTVGADFSLYRTGEFRLTVDGEQPVSDEFPDDEEEGRFAYLMASQMYYFVKDIGHRHYHHQSSSDNLLPLVDATNDDIAWRRETVWSLARAVLELRRQNRTAGQKHALGILAYADAFQIHLARIRRRSDGTGFELIDAAPKYDFAHTRLSLEATIEEQDYRRSFWSQFQGVMIATTLAGAALWIAGVDIREAACLPHPACVAPTPPDWLRAILRYVVEEPLVPFGILFFFGLVYLEYVRASLVSVSLLRRYMNFVSEWSVALGVTASRLLRRVHPYGGDAFGNAVSVFAAVCIAFEVLNLGAAIFDLWPPKSVTAWLAEAITSFFRSVLTAR
jgi:hypothetical protein